MSAKRTASLLFLCQKNSARSQMAEAFLRRLAGDRFEVHSAGLEAARIHPLTKQVMNEIGYDLKGHHSKSAQQHLGKSTFTSVVTVCEPARENCPRLFPGALKHLYWPFPDPTEVDGDEGARLAVFRDVRDAIRARITSWLASDESTAAAGGIAPAH